jgi:sugar fermentation stimulation protein A
VEKGKDHRLINMDAQAPNRVVAEALIEGTLCLPGLAGPLTARPEAVFGASRFDFLVRDREGREGYLEVKGVTLEEDGVASFPDAPTERGVKHVLELVQARGQGYAACLLFVIQMEGMRVFQPNDICHAAFGEALRYATAQGVTVMARQCAVTPDSLRLTTAVPVRLSGKVAD